MREADLIKAKLDLVDVIKSYVNLSPAGKNFKGLCPFHSETKPSFMVSPERGLWHCFGCSTGGDLIKFVMMYENMEFPEALRFLAERAGIEIESVSRRDQKEFDNIYSINEAAKKFFVGELKKNKQIFDYLLSRGLKNETIEEFELGFSPGGDTLITHLLGSGFDLPVIVKAGLGLKSDRGLYKDWFLYLYSKPRIIQVNSTGHAPYSSISSTGQGCVDIYNFYLFFLLLGRLRGAAFLFAGLLRAGFFAAFFLLAGFLFAGFLTAFFLFAGFLFAGFLFTGFLFAGFLLAGFFAATLFLFLGIFVNYLFFNFKNDLCKKI